MKKKQLILLILILTVMAGLGNSVAYAASLCVHPNGANRCFTSIQAAVDAANSGDRIIIRAGKYIEQVTIAGKDVTLVGRDGAVLQAPADMQDTLSPIFGFPGRPVLLVSLDLTESGAVPANCVVGCGKVRVGLMLDDVAQRKRGTDDTCTRDCHAQPAAGYDTGKSHAIHIVGN